MIANPAAADDAAGWPRLKLTKCIKRILIGESAAESMLDPRDAE